MGSDLTGVTRWEMEEILQEAGVKLRLGPQTKDDLENEVDITLDIE